MLLSVTCPVCKAPIGVPCVLPVAMVVDAHGKARPTLDTHAMRYIVAGVR